MDFTFPIKPTRRITPSEEGSTLATSPFCRGWELGWKIAEASAHGHGDSETLRPIVADLMLRFSLFQPEVDRVIVGMRKIE
jgi:hypothetical protein